LLRLLIRSHARVDLVALMKTEHEV
jgi:hypothetical protein